MVDNVVPKDKWEFDKKVAECFDNMLERSIPDYHRMRDLTQILVLKHIHNLINASKEESVARPKYNLLDIGCSNGINLEMFENNTNIKGFGVDISQPMIDKATEKFKYSNIEVANYDIRNGIKNMPEPFPNKYDIITSVLTLQFVPMEYRQDILADIYNSLPHDGIFIFVEKILGSSSVMNNLFVDSYYSIKNQNGYSYDAIDRKKKSLEGVLVPCTSEWNKDLLKQAGFRRIETFWKCLNFEGIIAIKD